MLAYYLFENIQKPFKSNVPIMFAKLKRFLTVFSTKNNIETTLRNTVLIPKWDGNVSKTFLKHIFVSNRSSLYVTNFRSQNAFLSEMDFWD